MKKMLIALLGVFAVTAAGSYAFADDKDWSRVALTTPNVAPSADEAAADAAKFIATKVDEGEVAAAEEVLQAIAAASATDAEETFISYLWYQIPEGVNVLEGKSSYMGGFSADLTFTADQETFKQISREYSRLPMSTVEAQAKTWFQEDVTANPDVDCYFKTDGLNKYYLFWDKSGGKVYFKGTKS